MDDCLFHSRRWRGVTQQLLNSVRGKLLLPRHIRRFSKVVCTCKGGSIGHDYTLADLEQWCSGIDPTSPVSSASPLLKNLLTSANDPSLSNEARSGIVGVVALLKEASDGNYQRLEPEPKDASVQLGPVVFKERFELPLSGGHVGLLLGSGGNFIKQLCSKHKVSVHLGEESKEGPKKRGHTYLSGDTIKVTVSHVPEEKADVEGFKEELMRRATAVNESRKKHTSNVMAFAKQRQEYYLKRQLQRAGRSDERAPGYSGIHDNAKQAAAEQFKKKQQAKSKQTTSAKSTSGGSLLSEGHCLYCLAPYNQQDKDCKYHSGFLVAVKQDRPNQGYSWSCCKKRTASKHPTHDVHSKNGCCTGLHLWRPGKGTHTKGKAAVGDFSV